MAEWYERYACGWIQNDAGIARARKTLFAREGPLEVLPMIHRDPAEQGACFAHPARFFAAALDMLSGLPTEPP